jgi:Calx-beta domain/CARDB
VFATLPLSHRAGPRALALFVGVVMTVGGLVLGARPAAASAAEVHATGRFAYVDDKGAVIGIRSAPVTLCDDDGAFGCSVMAVGVTDTNGFFDLTGTGGDPFGDLPDPLVKVTATGPSGFIQPLTLVDYCFTSLPFNNAGNQSVNFGTITPSIGRGCNITGGSTAGTDGAWQLWNNVRQAWEFMRTQTLRNPGRDVPPVRVLWPDSISGSSFYRPPLPGLDSGSISIRANQAFLEPIIYHEYGHHILQHFGESPLPNYNNSTCDSINFLVFGGHCFWRSEKGVVEWTEGWPDFLSEVLSTTNGTNDTASSLFGCDLIVPTICGSVESPPLPSPDSDLVHVEGTTAAVLWDLLDNSPDNRDGDNSTDRLSLSFATLWDVYQGFDPDPFTAHNRTLDLDELWNAFAAQRPTELNRVSEIYDENGLTKPSADLSVTSVSTSASNVFPGQSLDVTDATANIGAVRTGTSSVTRLYLKQGIFGVAIPLGTRSVGDLLSGGNSSTGTTTVNVPMTARPGDYLVLACADDDHTTFESNETNNCLGTDSFTVSAPTVTLPTISIGDASVTEGNSGTVAINFPVTVSASSSSPVSVDYATANGNAKAPADYVAKTGTLTFNPGDPLTKNISVLVNGDQLDENNETFTVMLSNPSSVTISDGSASGQITDDDPTPSLRISDVRHAEGNSGTTDFTFRITLSHVSGRTIHVNFRTLNGSAVAPSDYRARNDQLTINPNTPYRTVTVKVNGDRIHEANETFKLRLSSPSAARIADADGLGTIVNDD